MERSELLISLTPSAEKQFQTATAHQRIISCITKRLPITDAIFTGLLLLEDKDKERLLRIAEEHIRTMDLPISSSLTREIEKTALRVRETIGRLKEERLLLPEDLTTLPDCLIAALSKDEDGVMKLETSDDIRNNHG